MTAASPRNERRLLGGAVFRIRKLQQLTQAEVATRGGFDETGKPLLDHTLISHIEKNRRTATIDQMCALANALGCDMDEITYFANIYVVSPAEQVPA